MAPTSAELWAHAHHVLEKHGDQAPRFAAERIGFLILNGDDSAVAVWKAIAMRIEQLRVPHDRSAQ